MKQFLLLAFFLVAGAAWGQTDDGWETVVSSEPRRAVPGARLIYGSEVDFDVGEIFLKGFEMVFAPRLFRENWPRYGYAIPNSRVDDSCGLLDEGYPDLTVGETAIVLSKSYDAAPGLHSFDHIGFPLESVAVVESGALATRATNSAIQSSPGHAGFRIGDVCRWLREPAGFEEPMRRIEALPYDLPEGTWTNTEFDGTSDLSVLMTGMIGEPQDAGTIPILTWNHEDAGTRRTIMWTPIHGDEYDSVIEGDNVWWQYTPSGQTESRFDYYISRSRSGADTVSESTVWSSPSGAMQWYRMPVGEDSAHSPFTMWYAPGSDRGREDHGRTPAQTGRDWYLLTEEPLPRLATDIRFETHFTVPPE